MGIDIFQFEKPIKKKAYTESRLYTGAMYYSLVHYFDDFESHCKPLQSKNDFNIQHS